MNTQTSSNSTPPLSRRRFLAGAGVAAAAFSLVPRHVLGGAKYVAPSEKINLAYIGCGTQGLRQLMPALEKTELNIVAVCDPNRKSDDYPEWGRRELNDKISKFLADANWAKNARGGLCGREVGEELVNRYDSKQKRSGQASPCRTYIEFRELLEK